MQLPQIGPEAVLGIEINAYAAELARVTIWIGEIQWMIRHGLGYRRDPILKSLHHIETRDALLDLSDPSNPREAEWPEAEFIVGNPPFLGGKWMRRAFGDVHLDTLFRVFDGRVPRNADFVTYWHEKARVQIERRRSRRAGLLATQGIRHSASRPVLDAIKGSGDIFFARADEPWILAGASVHISFVAQDDGSEANRELDGQPVAAINPNLTAGSDVTQARRLLVNAATCFMSATKGGPFEIEATTAAWMLAQPNPDGRANTDVLRPWMNAADLMGRSRGMWIIDFGVGMPEGEAALYEAPFEYVRQNVLPVRQKSRTTIESWWQLERPRPEMRASIASLTRILVTPAVSRHRVFCWLGAHVLPDHRILVIARDDDYTLGVLHSRVHEIWARATGGQLREAESGFTYTPTTCFETFPFPDPTPEQRERVGEAARRLVELRDGWLNPPGLDPADLAKRTLTNLYNQRPTWLANAHADLDAAVFAAYRWPTDLADAEMLERLLDLNLERADTGPGE
jgi:type II restriction/modification system DNA methylase subunit YeeA